MTLPSHTILITSAMYQEIDDHIKAGGVVFLTGMPPQRENAIRAWGSRMGYTGRLHIVRGEQDGLTGFFVYLDKQPVAM